MKCDIVKLLKLQTLSTVSLISYCMPKSLQCNSLDPQRIFQGITTQNTIQILKPAEIRTYRNVLYRAPMLVRPLRLIPRTSLLLPRNPVPRSCQINVHIGPTQLFDRWVHHIPLGSGVTFDKPIILLSTPVVKILRCLDLELYT